MRIAWFCISQENCVEWGKISSKKCENFTEDNKMLEVAKKVWTKLLVIQNLNTGHLDGVTSNLINIKFLTF